ncbi:MAG: DUF2200 domain-containing protein [Flavobacteriaceae bacterium]|nr:DUF2200 domain-containing protein [Flavobacteriaceae bacterium]
MEVTQKRIDKIASLKFSSVYPHYVSKIEKKGRTVAELYQVISWLTGFSENEIKSFINSKDTFQEFFEKAKINPNATLIKGVICGYRVEEIENDLVRNTRYLDKLIDELAKGRKMEKILRQ